MQFTETRNVNINPQKASRITTQLNTKILEQNLKVCR